MDTYKRFTSQDIIVGDTQFVSSPMWSNGDDIIDITTAYTQVPAANANFYSYEYYQPVYNADPSSDPNAEVQFSIAYGHYAGSGSAGDPTIRSNTFDTPSKIVYRQFASILLDPGVDKFVINGTAVDDAFFITINRARYKQRIDPGNWQLEVGTISIVDGSGAGEDPNVNSAGRIFSIYEIDTATGEIDTTTELGLMYADMGIIVLKSSLIAGINTNAVAAGAANLKFNAYIAYTKLGEFQARTEEKVTSNYYFVRVTNQQFNYSSNPTFISGSNGAFRWSAMQTNPQVYITTVGLYDDANQLLAVAKLSKPVLKNFNREALIKVKIDY